MFHIIKFDLNEYDPTDIGVIGKELRNVLPEEDIIIALPYGVDFLANVPKSELEHMKNLIDDYLKENMESEES